MIADQRGGDDWRLPLLLWMECLGDVLATLTSEAQQTRKSDNYKRLRMLFIRSNRNDRLLFLLCAVLILALCAPLGAESPGVRIRGGHKWGFSAIGAIGKRFCQLNPKAAGLFDCKKWSDWKNLQKYQAGECDILVHYSLDGVQKDKSGRLTRADGSEVYLIGQAKVAAIVNQRNSVKNLTQTQIRKIIGFKAEGMKWSAISGDDESLHHDGQGYYGGSWGYVVRHSDNGSILQTES